MKAGCHHGVSYRSLSCGWLLRGLMFGLCLWGHAADLDKSDILGRAGDQAVTVQDMRALLAALEPQGQARVSQDAALLSQMVRSYLVQKAVLREAREKKWDESPAVQAQLERARDTALTESYLQAMTQPPESFPNEEELHAGYEAAKPSLLVPRSFLLAQIFIAAPKEDDATQKIHAKLESVRNALRSAGADFAAIARERSEEPASAGNGGEIGWLTETQIQPEIQAQLPKLKFNVVSEPLRLNDGWHILKVLDAREPYTPTLEQVRVQLREQMRAERKRSNAQAYLAKLIQAHPLVIDEQALAKILPTAATQ